MEFKIYRERVKGRYNTIYELPDGELVYFPDNLFWNWKDAKNVMDKIVETRILIKIYKGNGNASLYSGSY